MTTEGKKVRVKLERAYGGCHRHQEAKKDAAGCEKPRGAASEQRSVDIRMGQPILRKVRILYAESKGIQGGPREVKHLSTWRKRNQERFPQ